MAAPLRLEGDLVDLLRHTLPDVAVHTVTAVRDEVPAYSEGLGEQMAGTHRAGRADGAGRLPARGRARGGPGDPAPPDRRGGVRARARARPGPAARPTPCSSAYRVGARVSWRELSATAVAAGVSAQAVASFAEMVFAYIDELSAASVAGHTDELETSGRLRQRYLDRLAVGLLRGEPADALTRAAERADWKPPRTLTAVLLPEAQVRPVLGLVPSGALAPGEPPALPEEGLAVVLVPDMGGRSRARLLRVLADRHAVVGPARPWLEARASYDRAVRGLALRDVRRPGRHRPQPRVAGRRRRPRGAGRPARARRSRRSPTSGPRPPRSSRRRCARGCSTRAAARTSRPTCSSTRRRCATGWASCASCTATGSRTRRRCWR